MVEIGSVLEIGRGSAKAGVPRLQKEDPYMSRTHAAVLVGDSGTALLRDLGSQNGTYANGEFVCGEIPLRNGTVIFIGAHVFVYRRISRDDVVAISAELRAPFGPARTYSATMARLSARLKKLARTDIDLLFRGETGVGKEVLAEAVHRESGRRGAFVAINCAAIPDSLVESELFGYARGAHSMADHAKPGLIERAEGGTLFLDEIGDMPFSAQSKLLRFLEDRQLLSLGTTRGQKLNLRVVAATGRAIICQERPSGLRLDLAVRLGPEPLVVPPLRERPEDIGLLISHFLRDQPCNFNIKAYRALFLHAWPGNVRELKKAVRLAGILSEGHDAIQIIDLPMEYAPTVEEKTAKPACDFRERPSVGELSSLLVRYQGNVGGVARAIGRQRTLVWRWIRKAGLKPAVYRDQG
jgi:propionate catabolism operon transcriptional regulator